MPTRLPTQRERLIEELVGQREAVIQACWAQQVWARPVGEHSPLRTTDGRTLEVYFPGWINRGAGPDFTQARIRISGTEHVGDVELHLDERDWHRHGHDGDPAYGRVVLHVVLQDLDTPNPAGAMHPHTGARLPVFALTPHLSPDVLALMDEPGALLRRYESLPGRCGLRAAIAEPDAVEAVIAHAAEVRARAKADQLLPGWLGDEEQLLFELIFQSLGYRPFAPAFRQVAQRFPLSRMHAHFALPPGASPEAVAASRREVLSRWLGAAGLLGGPEPVEPEARAEWRELAAHWSSLGERGLEAPLRRGGARPWNSPERRMVGLFHHLTSLPGGLLKGWLVFLKRLDALRDEPEFRPRALAMLQAAFATPDSEPWRHRVSFATPTLKQEARLIGDDRIAVVLANAIVPFFLAYSRRREDTELEKTLYRLFIVLPGEGPNAKTRFMLQRLLPLRPLPRSLRTQQGLIQVHRDFCISFESGCEDCRFPDLIRKQGPVG